MRRLSLLLLPVLAALALFAAPALSTERWRPPALDFELSLPDTGLARAAGSGLWTSRPIEPGKRFDLVGLRWERTERPVEVWMRTRSAEDGWSRWVAAEGEINEPASAGVWAGGADAFQVAFDQRPRGLRAHLVNTTGSATPRQRAATAVRSALNTAVIATVGTATAWAQGGSGPPAMVAREAWGAAQCPPREAPSYGEVKLGLVHHTVSTNDYAPSEGAAIVLAICRYHRNSNGWSDIGYNFLVDRYGTIYEGRAGGIDRAVIGAQAQGFNAVSTGVAALGTYTSAPPPGAQVSAIADVLAWKLPAHGAPTTGEVVATSAGGSQNRYPAGRQVTFQRISGHRDAGKTTCPGDAMVANFEALRSMAAARQQPLAGPGTATRPSAPATGRLHPPKLEILRSSIVRDARALDVLAPITARASGTVAVELHAAGRRHRFTAPVESARRRVRFRSALPAEQARLGTGILTITYPGDADTRPQELRLRAANGRAGLEVRRPQLVDGRLRASGSISSRATGVVRVAISYVHRGQAHTLERHAHIRDGRWSLDAEVPADDRARIAQRSGTVHSTTAYTGDLGRRIRGEARTLQVLGAP